MLVATPKIREIATTAIREGDDRSGHDCRCDYRILSGYAVIQELSTCPARGFWGPYSGWLCCCTSWRQKRKDGRYDK
jgi:hypothetical protein